jgi:hypothetical protein
MRSLYHPVNSRSTKRQILVHDHRSQQFHCQAGQASKLAAQLKEMATAGNLPNPRVLTDMTGPFNSVVME